jgi:hypothetical protein
MTTAAARQLPIEADPVPALIAEYERLERIIVPLEDRAEELRRTLPVYLRGPAHVHDSATTFLTELEIEAYADEYDCPPEWIAARRADLAAYKAVIAEAEEACGIAALEREAEEIGEVRSEIYGKILDTPASSFDGLEAHLRFLIDADPDEIAIILAGLDHLRRRYEPALIGFGPR